MGFAQPWRGEEAAAPRKRAEEEREEEEERTGEEERETGTGSALEIWTPGGVTVTRRETGEMGTEWNGARETGSRLRLADCRGPHGFAAVATRSVLPGPPAGYGAYRGGYLNKRAGRW